MGIGFNSKQQSNIALSKRRPYHVVVVNAGAAARHATRDIPFARTVSGNGREERKHNTGAGKAERGEGCIKRREDFS